MISRRLFLHAVGFTAASTLLPRAAPAAGSSIVAAAADLQFALPQIVAAFEKKTGETVRISFGSSGNLSRQIRQGAPFGLFLSADEQYVLRLAADGFTRGEGAVYALGRIALVVPHGSPLKPDGSLDDLARALHAGRVTRFAIANPAHAPYGKRAEEALRHRGLWKAIQPKLVLGENVAQATQFAVSGNTDGGIVAQSLTVAPEIRAKADSALIPADWHSPLRQRMALTNEAGPAAEAFYQFLEGSQARVILERYGFSLPGQGS